MKKHAVIVAGGSGTRLGGEKPKQFQDLKGWPMFLWSVNAFLKEDPDTVIILVFPESFSREGKDLINKYIPEAAHKIKITIGGKSRTESVNNGLSLVDGSGEAFVCVHDAARPLINPHLIARGWKEAELNKSAVPVVEMTDSLRMKVGADRTVPVDRNLYLKVQTPQFFKAAILKDAYAEAGNNVYSDDASLVESLGGKISIFPGDQTNIKVTNPGDLEIASVLLSNP